MSHSADFLHKLAVPIGHKPSSAALNAFNLQPTDALKLQELARADCRSTFFKACVSIADAFLGIGSELTSWAVVNLYYSVFYCARCRLESAGECHVYFGK